jgi:hypothetical protein
MINMPVFLAFLAGGLFTALVSEKTKNNIRDVNRELNDVLDNRRELIEKVDELLRQKELSGEIKIERNY